MNNHNPSDTDRQLPLPDTASDVTASARPLITPELVSQLARSIGNKAKAALVWFYLHARADKWTGKAWPSTKTIANDLRMFRSRVQECLRVLSASGWLRIDGGRGVLNTYYITTPPVVVSEPGQVPTGDVRSSGQELSGKCGRGVSAPADNHSNTTKNTTKNTPARAASLDELIQNWNAIQGVIHCREATAKRRTAFRQRVESDGWWTNLLTALPKIAASDFLRGSGDRGWRADLDWLLRPDSVAHVLEGKYDNRGAEIGTGRGPIQTSFK